ncbi:MAG: hypothetical protein ACJ8IK_19230 [Burkholderiaceae bacterium]|jgi:hypothetical protein
MADPRRLPATDREPSLDEQIAQAERAVIARDLRIRRRADALVRHAKREAIKHAGGGLLLGVGTIALTWWLNHLNRKNAPPPAPPAPETAHGTFEHLFRDAGVILAGLLPMLWPMVPRSWRRGVTPGTAGTVLTFLAPLLGKLFRRKPREGQAA